MAVPWVFGRQIGGRPAAPVKLCKDKEFTPTPLHSVHSAGISSLQVDPAEGRFLLAGSVDAAVSCYDLHQSPQEATGIKPLFCQKRHQFSISSVHWYTADSGSFLTGSFDEHVLVWDANAQKPFLDVEVDEKVYQMAMAPRATHHALVAVVTGDPRVSFLDLLVGGVTFTLPNGPDPCTAAQWAPASQFVIACAASNGTVQLWDVRRLQGSVANLCHGETQRAHDEGGVALGFTHDGRYLLSCGVDKKLRLWDMLRNADLSVTIPVACTQTRGALKVTADNSAVILPKDTAISSVDLETGVAVDTIKAHLAPASALATHTQTEAFFSGGQDKQVLMWSLATKRGEPAANADQWSDHDD